MNPPEIVGIVVAGEPASLRTRVLAHNGLLCGLIWVNQLPVIGRLRRTPEIVARTCRVARGRRD